MYLEKENKSVLFIVLYCLPFIVWSLEKIFTKNIYGDKDKRDRDKMIGEAVYRYGYKQKQIADHLGMHFTSISRILNQRDGLLKK